MSSKKAEDWLKEREPKPGTGHYAQKSEYWKKLSAAVAQDLKERSEDGATYLQKYDDKVQAASRRFSQEMSAESFQDYRTALLAASDMRGMGVEKLFSKAEAKTLGAKLESVDNPAQYARVLADIFRAETPKAMQEIFRETAPLVMAASTMPREYEEAGKLLVKISRDKDFMETSKTGLLGKKIDPREVLESVDETLGKMNATLLVNGDNKLARAISDGCYRLSLAYSNRGLGSEEAVERACREVVLSRYEFGVNRNGLPFRIDRDWDAQKIARGADNFLKALSENDVALNIREIFPKEAATKDRLNFIRKNAHWRTSPTENGLRLYVLNRLLLDPKGKPVELTWEQLQSASFDESDSAYSLEEY